MTNRSTITLALALMSACSHDDSTDTWPDPTAATLDPREDMPNGHGDGDGESTTVALADVPETGDGDGDGEFIGPGICQRVETGALQQVALPEACQPPDVWICTVGTFAAAPVATVCCDFGFPNGCTMLAPAQPCPAVMWAACEV